MDYIFGWKKYKTEFNGDKITMQLLPLTVEAMIALTPVISNAMEKDLSAVETQIQALEIQRAAAPIVKDHIKDVTGFTINGKPPEPVGFCGIPGFWLLVADIIGKLVTDSQLEQAEVKNLDGQSGSSTKENVGQKE